jgi:hypothetical protein
MSEARETGEFRGLVSRHTVAEGSKSERDAVVLVTEGGELTLRRMGGNPFADPELDALVGRRLRFTGTVRGTTLIVRDWREDSEAPPSEAPPSEAPPAGDGA